MNVLGDPDDQRGPIAGERWSIHRLPPLLEDRVSFAPKCFVPSFHQSFFLGLQKKIF